MSPYLFSIVRRGDVASIRNKRYTLKELPRILCAILLEKPGTARTGSNKSLIEIDISNKRFKNEDLFPTIWSADQFSKTLFKKHYKAVNFAMALYEKIDMLASDKEIEESLNEKDEIYINKYGKYLMIFSIVKVLKGNKDTFEEWAYTDKYVNEILDKEKYKYIIKALTVAWNDKVEGQNIKWDSNAFKNNENITKTYVACEEFIKDIIEGKQPVLA
ncbi:hypothetical protein IAE22_26245 [Bacillus sp. S34]|nr:hypothetical protein [Bacillus sp. S34]